ncbi:hypothetical protein [Vibrio nigripulchritudo]|uniref:hypothetical protein n=1 Tax=Vibrio nigripulchritudo TaxID=28173 RepID=UPI0003B215EC|nr:hypothetical protein [Vibrio nigripulchritudo]CCN70244.1 hypothetical protein VIBNISFn118_1950002 [Vibrio nigripulchritudo SFn118]
MIIKVDEREIESKRIIYNDQSFGNPTERAECEYEIVLSKSDFIELFESEYDNYVNECKEDDEANGEVDIPILNKAGYPLLLKTLSENAELFIYLIEEYMYFNLFDCLFDKRNRSEWEFAINSIKDISIDDDSIIIRGKAYPI